MANKRRYTDEDLFQMARDVHARTGRVPLHRDLPSGIIVLARRRFGSWGEFLRRALNVTAANRPWTPERAASMVREHYAQHKQFPTCAEMKLRSKTLPIMLRRYHGSVDAGMEAILGNSPRRIVLAAMRELSSQGCDQLTIAEIQTVTSRRAEFRSGLLSFTVSDMLKDGLVTTGLYSQTRWWKLLPAGRAYLASLESKDRDHGSANRTTTLPTAAPRHAANR